MKWPKNACSDMIYNPKGVSFCPVKKYNHPKCLTKCTCDKGCCKKPKSLEYIKEKISHIFI